MARRSSAFEDLMALGARLPWSVALGLALFSYLGLHWAASYYSVPVAASTLTDIATVAQRQLIASLAFFLQWVIPIGFGVGALASVIKRTRGVALFSRACAGGTDAVARLTWSEFERITGEGFRRQGFAVADNLRGGPDGGVDLVLRKGSKQILVQCKHWRSSSVGVAVVRELYGVMTARSADGGFVVTSGSFTPDAWDFAAQCGIELIDGARLGVWIPRAKDPAKGNPIPVPESPVVPPAASGTSTPACPKCGVDMVLRTARRGTAAGQLFWGCSQFPRCRATIPA
jgi:restriction system protein